MASIRVYSTRMIENSKSAEDDPAKQGLDEEPGERSSGFILYSMDRGVRKYLLLRHRYGEHWGFPKGHIEAGESEIEAAMREMREETGITEVQLIPDFRKVSRYHFYRGRRPVFKENVYFLGCVRYSQPVISDEHTKSEWLPYAEARERLTFNDTRYMLDAAEQLLSRA